MIRDGLTADRIIVYHTVIMDCGIDYIISNVKQFFHFGFYNSKGVVVKFCNGTVPTPSDYRCYEKKCGIDTYIYCTANITLDNLSYCFGDNKEYRNSGRLKDLIDCNHVVKTGWLKAPFGGQKWRKGISVEVE